MKKYEYSIVSSTSRAEFIHHLNVLGEEGYRVIHNQCENQFYYALLEREIGEEVIE